MVRSHCAATTPPAQATVVLTLLDRTAASPETEAQAATAASAAATYARKDSGSPPCAPHPPPTPPAVGKRAVQRVSQGKRQHEEELCHVEHEELGEERLSARGAVDGMGLKRAGLEVLSKVRPAKHRGHQKDAAEPHGNHGARQRVEALQGVVASAHIHKLVQPEDDQEGEQKLPLVDKPVHLGPQEPPHHAHRA